MPGKVAPNGHHMLSSFVNVCRFLCIPLSLRLFDHMFDVRLRSKETLGFVVVSSHQGRTFLCGIPPSNKKWKDKYVSIKFPSATFPFAQNVWGKRMKRQPLSQPSGQPFSLDEQTAQSHQDTNQPIHSGKLYNNVDTMEFENLMGETGHTSEAGQGGQQIEGGRDEEEAVEGALQRKRRRAEEVNQPVQSSDAGKEHGELRLFALMVGRIGLEYFTRLVKSRDEEKARLEAMMAAKEAGAQAQEKIEKLEAENARSGEEIARLGDELEKERAERATLAAAWATQEPEEFAARALPDQETAIRFFQGLYKHKVSAKVVDDIETFGFESGQYDERRALYGILQHRIQGFEPKALSLPKLHDEVPVPPFPGI
ncbi:unnamed protein product [Cuscuta campestris]|uniref:Uncharacterized protein n=1 Tax=Cuscuta campestris TaxID=132261 RepID=A0A484L3L2_9ASTE|nr:unnamed protein product [Cuscuta campestris]